MAEKYVESGKPVLTEPVKQEKSAELENNAHFTKFVNAIFALVEHSRLSLYANRLELVLKMRNDVLGPRVCPYNGLAKWFTGFSAPCNGSLALIRDS